MRRLRRIRQLVPTKFATAYRHDVQPGGRNVPVFVSWWMWLGRCFRVRRIEI